MADEEATPPGLAGHLKNALTGAHEVLSDKLHAARIAHTTDVLETFERDLAPLLAEHVQIVLDNPATPDHLKALLSEIGAPQHFSSSLLIGVAVGAIIAPVLGAATSPLVQDIENAAWTARQTRPLTPDLLAASVLKSVQAEGAAADEAALSGISSGRFAQMVETAGQSIGIAEALLLWRRDQIDLAHLVEIVQYSNVNPKFYDDIPKLRYGPPSVGEVITGALKTHLDQPTARVMLGHAGIDPTNFDWLLATAGRPISPLEALHLWNRQLIDEARVDDVIAQSDINPSFAPEVKMLREYFPPPRSVVPMLRSGSITEAQARTLLSYYGVAPEWVDAFIKEAQHTTTSSAKQLTQAQVINVYEARLIDRPTATARLTALKLPPEDVILLLDLADEKRTLTLQNAGIRAVGTKYVAHKMTKPEASSALGALTVPSTAQHDLFTVWDVERQISYHALTPSMIVGAFRRGEIDAAETKLRLLRLGVQADDLAIVVADGWPPTKPGAAQAAAAAVVNA